MVYLSPRPETNLYKGKNLFDDISFVTTLQPEKMFLPKLNQDSLFYQMPDIHLMATKDCMPQKMSTFVSMTILFGFIILSHFLSLPVYIYIYIYIYIYTHTHTHTQFHLLITYQLIMWYWLWNQLHKIIRTDNCNNNLVERKPNFKQLKSITQNDNI